MMSVKAVQAFIDAQRPVVISWGEGTAATVTLVDIADGYAWSKHKMRFPLSDITSIVPADGDASGMQRTGARRQS